MPFSATSATEVSLIFWFKEGRVWHLNSIPKGLVNEYIFYIAPALMGGDDGRPVFEGPGSATMADLWRGNIRDIRSIGTDIRVELRPLEGD